ncbi:ammonium transporter [Geobacter sulfurreducens]|jgi:Amt family ammonium transporter|uniref:Ammonium transporter n=1 Tax=Geobacter sulfurreducens (strain ATCC 51573 / DSM 12127 / PCA) TaxID=243231 RepID=Q74EM2_GEOSL|nr:ammonium transporter [Geobacter sulfurreducens]AAR34267.1 ammonium transporter [Geobacter sulfurreducens PCA]ADI83788.1 ammonium transporter [Geobacter sulfurreducens KN400]AJY70679.1 ammonium transporter [Geobacter sulfurreducens]QVW36184.1 ammonium transporter [Geobacter sulfurreducens]UAC04997.1 ammonium transporter [Geobacter sulfurreducens]
MKWKRSIITLALAAAAFMAPAAVLAEEAKAPAVAATQAAVTSAQAAPAAVAPAEAAPAAAEAPKVAEPVLNTGNTAWMLVCAALVLLMLPGLALFYGGMVRSKNVLSTLMHSFVAMGIVGVQWAVIGYSLAFGPDMGGMGLVGDFSRALLNGMISFKDGAPVYTLWQNVTSEPNAIPEYVFAMFQGMFAMITVALISGAMAERVKFSAYCVFVLLWTTLVYDPLAHWVWMVDGWLFKKGALDFAGGTVVHLSSGISALAFLVFLGKRHGFPHERMAPHNLSMTMLGVGLLWFGWFGFNAGSAVVGVNNVDAAGGLAGLAFATTTIAPAAGGLAWMIAEWIHAGRPSALGFGSGVVAGLVGITPAAGFVQPGAAIIIGLGAGVICYLGVLMKAKLKYDDSLDAFGVHGVGGTFGALVTGVFATVGATGLLSGNVSQFITQVIGVVSAGAYAFIVTLVIAFILDKTIGLRVEKEDEIMGLDQTQHSESAYN